MRLFLASEGSDVKTTQKLEEYVEGFNGKSVLYIPTARNGLGRLNTWKDSNTWKFLNSTGMNVDSLQLEDYVYNLDLKLFEGKDIIWFSGGTASYLMYWIIRTGFDSILPKILERSLYVGSSAGSMVTGPNLDVCEWYIGETERGAKYIPSLKLIDFDIYPHYDESNYEKIKENYKGKKIYLLKNGEEIIVADGKITVVGEERIISNE
jgi:peptidase E